MIRKADIGDIDRIAEIYREIHDEEEAGRMVIGWERKVYPTRDTAREAVKCGDMFVEEDEGQIVAAARINQEQVDVYADAAWTLEAADEQVMVLHTLVVSPKKNSSGYGKTFVKFYENYARERGCICLRIDTNARNENARAFYRKLGYTEVSIVDCVFNGIPDVHLVCLEKVL